MIYKHLNDQRLVWAVKDMSDLILTPAGSTEHIPTGKLIMDGQHAKQAVARWPRLPSAVLGPLGARATHQIEVGEWEDARYYEAGEYRMWADYFILVSDNWPKVKVGLFQTTRTPFMDAERPDVRQLIKGVIMKSAWYLAEWCRRHPFSRVDLGMPGIDQGLTAEEVLPLLQTLPDTVYVWRQA